MWVMQNDVLMEIPDDVPMPPNTRKIDVPEDFLTSPQDFKVVQGELIREPRKAVEAPRFTHEEIAFLKQFVANAVPKKEKEEEK
jgi:hypothetical protein